jgi:hypothetical protein
MTTDISHVQSEGAAGELRRQLDDAVRRRVAGTDIQGLRPG